MNHFERKLEVSDNGKEDTEEMELQAVIHIMLL